MGSVLDAASAALFYGIAVAAAVPIVAFWVISVKGESLYKKWFQMRGLEVPSPYSLTDGFRSARARRIASARNSGGCGRGIETPLRGQSASSSSAARANGMMVLRSESARSVTRPHELGEGQAEFLSRQCLPARADPL